MKAATIFLRNVVEARSQNPQRIDTRIYEYFQISLIEYPYPRFQTMSRVLSDAPQGNHMSVTTGVRVRGNNFVFSLLKDIEPGANLRDSNFLQIP